MREDVQKGANVERATTGSRQADVVVLDLSGSMFDGGFKGKRKIENVEEAMQGYLRAKREQCPEDRVSLIAYHDTATVLCDFLPVRTAFDQMAGIVSRLSQLDSGGTRLVSGLVAAFEVIHASQSMKRGNDVGGWRHRVIAYSDGEDHAPAEGICAADMLKAMGITIDCFGVARHRREVNEEFLRRVATEDADGVHYRFLGDAESLNQAFRKIALGSLTVDE